MKSIVFCLRLLAFYVVALQTAHAWGPEGHALVADMAWLNLTPETKVEVKRLLSLDKDGQNIDDVSSWADAIRSTNPETGPFHYVDIPLNSDSYDEQRDCHYDQHDKRVPEATCIVSALETQINILRDKSKDDTKRVAALKWVIHLVGDIHQPLHAEDNGDKGGNNVKVTYQKPDQTFHSVWDAGIIEKHYGWKLGPNFTFNHEAVNTEATKLNAQITPEQRSSWGLKYIPKNTDFVNWTNESHTIAKLAYAGLEKHKKNGWPESYQQEFWPIVSVQLQRAGTRLASVLNTSLPARRDTHENLNSILWMQQSAEYQMIAKGTYSNAYKTVTKALKDKKWSATLEQQGSFKNLPAAVIMDLDETVLDNSYAQAKFAIERGIYNPNEWNEWINSESAGLIPGSKEFIEKVQTLGIRVIFVTNRSQAQKEHTVQNLIKRQINIKDVEKDLLMCGELDKPTGCDKSRRRGLVAQEYRVLMLVGDDLGDFINGCKVPEQRTKDAEAHANYFGERWVILPNAIYGSWERSLSNPDFCKGIPSPTDEMQLSTKFQLLKSKNDN